jgi:hypothetical protein
VPCKLGGCGKGAGSSKINRRVIMTFVAGFVSYAIKFIIFAAVALAGIFAGKALRAKKDAK